MTQSKMIPSFEPMYVNPSSSSDQTTTILFLAANPKDTQHIQVYKELREIRQGLQRAPHRDQFRLEQNMAVRPHDIQLAMLSINPQIVHFSGHGAGAEGLIFEDENGNTQFVTGEELANLFSLFSDQLRCVVLNACYTEVQAQEIVQHIPYVIGMQKEIADQTAIDFAVAFYEALGAGRDVEFAFNLCTAITQESIVAPVPVLLRHSPMDKLVQQTREARSDSIKQDCGKMRVLNMSEPINLTGENGIYTNVNILKHPTRNHLTTEEPDLEDDRFSSKRRERLPGVEVVRNNTRLMVLGKPGSGKTTFLKYLAMQCITGQFAEDKVPFFVTLKDFAEAPGNPTLVEYLASSVSNTHTQPFYGNFRETTPVEIVRLLLQNGRVFSLLDGLDEVRNKDVRRIEQEIRNLASFTQSPVVITCRIAAKKIFLEPFTEVEVADFNNRQISTFVENWFGTNDSSLKAENFNRKLRLPRNDRIRELASNPLLLTLLCLGFGETGDFPQKRAELYKEGVKILLQKWDANKNIERDTVYRQLDVKQKKDLLSFIALETFSKGDLSVAEEKVQEYIGRFIRNLMDVDPTPEMLRRDSDAVLKSIQAQHGLLVEQTQGFYSFSHLTLQEYFTAREINLTTHPLRRIELVKMLKKHFSNPQWREVILLTMELSQSKDASDLLREFKTEIDSKTKLGNDRKVQDFLQWVQEKSDSILTEMSRDASDLFGEIKTEIDSNLSNEQQVQNFLQWAQEKLNSMAEISQNSSYMLRPIKTEIDLILAKGQLEQDFLQWVQEKLNSNLTFYKPLVRAFYYSLSLDFGNEIIWNLDPDFNWATCHDIQLDNKLSIVLSVATAPADLFLNGPLEDVLNILPEGDELKNQLRELYNRLPNPRSEILKPWRETNGLSWVEDLRTIMTTKRNIGQSRGFTPEKRKLLRQYYKSNLFLWECFQTASIVDLHTKKHIKETFLQIFKSNRLGKICREFILYILIHPNQPK